MKQEPYSIYIKKRSLKIAFLVNPVKDIIPQIQKVIDFNIHLWGGRYNPIIFSNGITIEENWWEFICSYDPDIILSLLPLENSLVEKIDNFLSPISLKMPENEIQDFDEYFIKCDYHSLTIEQSEENLKELYNSKLYLLDTNELKDVKLKQFINMNFVPFSNTRAISEMDKRKKNIVEINDAHSLNVAFSKIEQYDNFAFPIQFCTIPHDIKETRFKDTDNFFTVIIGDSPEDIVYKWNSILLTSKHYNRFLNNIWLPKEIALSGDFDDGFYKLFTNLATRQSVSGVCRIKFVSFSIKEKELTEIAQKLTKNSISKIIKAYENIRLPERIENYDYISIERDMIPYQVTGDKVQINISSPTIDKGFMLGESWIADVYIQHHPERYPNFQGRTLWWKLPKHSMLAFTLFNSSSRICSNGIPSVILARETKNLKINLINDSEVFRILLIEENKPFLKTDARYQLNHSRLAFIQPSNTGKYMSGFINLFKDLFIAKQFLEVRYWRHMFDLLSNFNPKKNEKKRQTAYDTLKKKSEEFIQSEKGLNWLVDDVLSLSSELGYSDKEIDFTIFKEEIEKEFNKFISIPRNKKLRYIVENFVEDLEETLKELIEMDIVHIGIKPQCPKCGLSQFFHIDEVQQTMLCKGCRSKFNIRPEENWFYKLNSLIRFGYSQQGLTPVILVLGQLFEECCSSFVFDTSQDIFISGSNKVFTDLDIVCIQDGKFIIGEVKQSVRKFKDDDFNKIKAVAEIIKPNKIIFSSLDKKCSKNIGNKINKLRKDLEMLKIEVEWYQLGKDVFDSTSFL